MGAVIDFKPAELQLIRRTVAKDCNDDEFLLFVHMCKAVGLDPLRKQAYAFVFGKSDKDQSKRQLTLVTSIQGYRTIAERTSNYRPDTQTPRYVYGEKSEINPLGIERCEVTVFKYSHGEWFPVVGEAYWDEHVPLKEGWDEAARQKTGKFFIDPKKTGWTKMPRLMIAKIAEASALRKAWPDDFSNVYAEEETDREASQLDAVEIIQKAEADARLQKIGGANALIVDWLDGNELCRVPMGSFMDQCMAFMKANVEEPNTVRVFQDRNRHAFNEFWGHQKGDALELKKTMEQVIAGNGAEVFKKTQKQIGAAA